MIAQWIGTNPERMKQFMHIFLHDEYRVVQRAAHVFAKICDTNPAMALPYTADLVQRMSDEGVHIAVKRNIVRSLQHIDLPEDLHGQVMNACFDFLSDPREPVAVRVFSMTILHRLSKSYPDIRQELLAILSDQLELGCSAGFRNRAEKIIRNTYKG